MSDLRISRGLRRKIGMVKTNRPKPNSISAILNDWSAPAPNERGTRMKRTLSTALAVVVVLGASALAQTLRDGPGIRDRAGMFSAPAVKAAEQVLREVENSGHWQVLIETRESVGDRNLREVAIENAKKAKLRGLSIAIVKNEEEARD